MIQVRRKAADHWRNGSFLMAMRSGRKLRVRAHVYGRWAAHRRLPTGGWRVSETTTGMSTALLADGLSEDDAKRIARLLAERVPEICLEGLRVGGWEGHIIEATIAEVLSP